MAKIWASSRIGQNFKFWLNYLLILNYNYKLIICQLTLGIRRAMLLNKPKIIFNSIRPFVNCCNIRRTKDFFTGCTFRKLFLYRKEFFYQNINFNASSMIFNSKTLIRIIHNHPNIFLCKIKSLLMILSKQKEENSFEN